MARFVSSRNVVSARTLKRKNAGSVVVLHYGREDVRFTRVHGGWSRQSVSERTEVVNSSTVADECNRSVGCRESWAKVY